jgi:hypothetical protein
MHPQETTPLIISNPQTWKDTRLAFGESKVDPALQQVKWLDVGIDNLERIWRPGLYFPNAKKTTVFHSTNIRNSFVRIEPDGRVYVSQRVRVTAMCPMQLRLFPMDSQTCKLEIESYGNTDCDVELYWGTNNKTAKGTNAYRPVEFRDFTLPHFQMIGYRYNRTKVRSILCNKAIAVSPARPNSSSSGLTRHKLGQTGPNSAYLGLIWFDYA